jgi:hypothetical protein
MHGHEKSDSVIVAAKPANKAERSAAELVEPRADGRHQIGTPAGFGSEQVAGFRLECMAGFVGIRSLLSLRLFILRKQRLDHL